MNVQVSTWLSRVNAKIAKISSGRIVFLATTGTQSKVGKRVFEDGKLTSGAPITYNQNYEVYAYKPPMPRKVSERGKPYDQWKRPPLTKSGSIRSGAAKIKGGYYATYLDAKDDQGRRDKFFELTGALRGTVTANALGERGYLSAAALVESSDGLTVDIVLDGKNADKWHGLTNQKGEFLELNPDERLDHVERMRDIWQKILDGDAQ